MIMSLRKTIALLLFFLVFGINSVVADKTVDPIIVGVVHSEAYPSASMMKRSFKMAVEAKNSKGGIKGRPLKLVYADDGLKGSGSIGYQRGKEESAIKSLVDRGAVMLIGGYSSANTIHTANLAEEFNIPLLVTTAADNHITQRKLNNVYRLNVPAAEYAGGLENLLKKTIRPKSIAIVYEASRYGTGASARMLSFCRDNGIKVTKLIPYQKDRVNAVYLEKRLRHIQRNPPDMIYMISYLDDAVMLVNTLRKLNINSWLVGGGGGFADPRFISMLGNSADGIVTASLWGPQLPYKGALDYYNHYLELYSAPPDYHGAEAYSAVIVAADVLERATTLKSEGIRSALDDTDLETPFGHVKFRSYAKYERQNSAPTVVLQIANSKFELVWPNDFATAGLFNPVTMTLAEQRN